MGEIMITGSKPLTISFNTAKEPSDAAADLPQETDPLLSHTQTNPAQDPAPVPNADPDLLSDLIGNGPVGDLADRLIKRRRQSQPLPCAPVIVWNQRAGRVSVRR